MTYWFVQLRGEEPPQKLTFNYNQTEHDRTKQVLTRLLQQLTDLRQRYTEGGEFFPQVEISSNLCDSCQFATRCSRTQDTKAFSANFLAETPVNWLPNLAIIEEISI